MIMKCQEEAIVKHSERLAYAFISDLNERQVNMMRKCTAKMTEFVKGYEPYIVYCDDTNCTSWTHQTLHMWLKTYAGESYTPQADVDDWRTYIKRVLNTREQQGGLAALNARRCDSCEN